MFFKQFYLGCLAQASYMVGSEGEAAVVDPRRDVDEYLDEAKRAGLEIRHVIETHLHADFVSGHRELARRTGAKIYFGARAGAAFDHVPVRDGDEVRFGQVALRFLETPGHTPESVCVLVFDRGAGEAPAAVLTGDTLFIGDVGRPDLAAETGVTAAELAGQLYDSLHRKLLTLPDSVAVYPAHGAGSLCGKNISSETSSTIGQQRRYNYALRPMSREDFVRMVTTDLPEAPAYFSRDVAINRRGASALSDLPDVPELSPGEIDERREAVRILDTRAAAAYGTAHVPGSTNIGLSGQFASWAGALLPPEAPIALVAEDPGRVGEARLRLTRVGLENVVGFLGGGIPAWQAAGLPLASTEQITVDELRQRLAERRVEQLIDVRRPGEWREGHIHSAKHIPLHELRERAGELDRKCPTTLICAGGYRSSIGTSVLEHAGFERITNVAGGMAAWNAAHFETESR